MTRRLIEMSGIVKSFSLGKTGTLTVLHGCDLQINSGEFVSIVGASGSGKSTLMNIIGLLDRPTQGNYLLTGKDVSSLSDDQQAQYRSEHIGFVFQNFNLVARMSARKNVEMPMMYAGVGKKERTRRARTP